MSLDFGKLAYLTSFKHNNRLKEITIDGTVTRGFIAEKYGKSRQLRFISEHLLIPVGYVQTKNAQHKRKEINRGNAV